MCVQECLYLCEGLSGGTSSSVFEPINVTCKSKIGALTNFSLLMTNCWM